MPVIRVKIEPDAWRTFNTKSMLGGAFEARRNMPRPNRWCWRATRDEAARNEYPSPAKVRLTEALERLVQLDEALEKKDDAAKWEGAGVSEGGTGAAEGR